MRFRRVGTLVATACALLVATALPAAAHNELKSSNPKSGATVETPINAVVLTFSENLTPGKITVTVTGPDGANVAAGELKVEGPTATAPITPATAGAYTVAYKVTAADGDVASKQFAFTLAPTAVAPTTTIAPTTTTTTTTTTAPTTTPPPTTSAQNTAASSDSGTTWWPWLVVILAVILIAVVLLILRRRRTTNA